MKETEDLLKKVQSRTVITCPHCKYEYLPCEVLFPDQVIGQIKPNSVVRDPLGHILYEEYNEEQEPLAEDHFICENCGKQFVIEICPKFSTKEESELLDFSNEAVSLW